MNNGLPEKIIKEIKKRGITPLPRWHFLLKRGVIWTLAVFSIVLGSIGFATIIFIFVDYDESVIKYLTESIFVDVLEMIPYFWLGTLAIIIGATQYAVRHTKFGYRYTTARIVGFVFAGSVVLGTLLYSLGVGARVQNFLVMSSPYYNELTYTSKDAWSHPERGLLGGTITSVVGPEEIVLTDFKNKIWNINTAEVTIQGGVNIVQQGVMVKIFGKQKSDSSFYAEDMFSWEK